MKKLFIYFAVISILFSCNFQRPPKAMDMAENLTKVYTPANTFYAVWSYKIKGLLRKDTFETKVAAWVIRDFQDTVWKAQILTNYYRDSSYGIYYRGEGYIYSPKKNLLTHYPQKYAKYAVTGYGSRIFTYFIEPEKLVKLINDTLNKVSVSDTIINNKKYWALQIKLPDEEDFTNQLLTFYFDPKTKYLRGYSHRVYVISDWQISFAFADTIALNTLADNYIKNFYEHAKATAQIKELPIGDEQEEEMKLLTIGTKAPDIVGTYYRTGEKFDLYQQNAKVYVIDFWYQSCRPCMRAVPYLVDLYKKYQEQGLLVLGVNSVDNTDQRRPYLKKFIEYKNMIYPIIMVDRAIDRMYKVPGYPTVYVLDSNKKIVGYEVGFDPDKRLDRVEQMVEEVLNKNNN